MAADTIVRQGKELLLRFEIQAVFLHVYVRTSRLAFTTDYPRTGFRHLAKPERKYALGRITKPIQYMADDGILASLSYY